MCQHPRRHSQVMFDRESLGRRVTSPAFFMCHYGTGRTGMKIASCLIGGAAVQKWTRAAKWRFAALPRPTVPYRLDRSRGGLRRRCESRRGRGGAPAQSSNQHSITIGRITLSAWSVIGLEGVVPSPIRAVARIAPLDMAGSAWCSIDARARPIIVVIEQPGTEQAKPEIDTGIIPAAAVVATIAPAVVTPAAPPATITAPAIAAPVAATPTVASPAAITTPATVTAPAATPFIDPDSAAATTAGPAIADL